MTIAITTTSINQNLNGHFVREGSTMVNVQNAGEMYRCRVCGNVVIVREAGGGELVCHGEPMQLVEGQENAKG
jgi:desulfoferrodoxin-like iron-binding protein